MTMNEAPKYEVYAIKYATRDATCSSYFHGPADPHEDFSMTMDYFIWLIKSDQHAIVVDTGFNEEEAKKRKRTFLRCPISLLPEFGVEVDSVSQVVITHMHYDHLGNADKIPNGQFIVQEAEMAFWTGKYASRKEFLHHVRPDDVVHLVQENFKGRVKFVNGSKEILPGISVHKTGGHSEGLQVVEVPTEKGKVILASDVSHFYKNIQEDRPSSIVANLAQMYDAFDFVNDLDESPDLIIPGHDPAVMEKFPAVEGLEGIAVRIA
ncbi:N-acyl homoserine lactonase family protein [Neobacillus citreus]|uniref:N-acyl homoserine lactonase family protein n=1 Tax=Neobacillus citreus TaxID=2833578 RepID=A0A942YEN7_9BACI|nr:N-acyl homoserine lactonase family protein [Neobacillus citreus]MCH6267067.1 N-acyl homoserine lactonase family protein [Neobacillus citreus]